MFSSKKQAEKKKPSTLLSVIAGLVLALSLIVLIYPSVTDITGKPLPKFSLPLVGSEGSLSNSDFSGEVKIINFFASWCGYCAMEHQTLQELREKHGVKIYGVNWRDSQPKAEEWLKVKTPVYEKVGFDPEGVVGSMFGVHGVPVTFVVDADGKVLARIANPLTTQIIEEKIAPLLTTK